MAHERILLVDDDHAFRVTTSALLRDDGYVVVTAGDGAEGLVALRSGPFDLLILDLRMPGVHGLGIVEALRRWGHDLPILMISGFGTVSDAVEALHLGTDDFLTKPVDPAVLSDRVARLLERRPMPGQQLTAPGATIIGRSPAMSAVYEAIRLVGPTEATVLLCGETGTGKELVARAIHDASAHSKGPFVAVNCAALPDGLLESELFGHVRGAFTGAVRDHAGLFRAAQHGTLLLDEIGDVSPALQHRLLRVLQERELTPVGGNETVRLNVRVIAATNRDLRAAVAAGRFREDLYYRLKVFQIDLPPLRERKSDIPLLVHHMLSRGSKSASGETTCSPFAMRLLEAYDWPGNVRELVAVLESARIRAGSHRLEAQHLPPELREDRRVPTDAGGGPIDFIAPIDPDAIRAALQQAGGVRARAAELLGIGRTTLWRKMKLYGIAETESL